jgi:glycosyltransferase involved in cell wall biosynthesis
MAPRDVALRGFNLGVPKAGDSVDAGGVVLRGWALGEAEPALGVEVVHDGRVIARAPLAKQRPDIVAAHPDLGHAASSGFERVVDLRAAAGELQLEVRAVIGPARRADLAALRLRPAPRSGERVAVVIPCFNQAHFLAEAIESVIAQTHPNVEIVVVDDGSRDNTVEVAGRYPGVRCVSQENRGLAAARNRGLEEAETEFVVFVDADDRLLPEAIESGLRELRAEPGAAMAAGAWRLIGEDGRVLPSSPVTMPEEAYPALLEGCFLSAPAAAIYRRRLFDEVGGFDPEVDASADYDLYLRVAAVHPVRLHEEVVAEYRRHGSNMTRDAGLIMRSELAVLRRQSPIVRDRPELRAARDRGLRRSRAYHGERMLDEIQRQVEAGRREQAWRVAAALARLHPRRAPEALRALRRAGRG